MKVAQLIARLAKADPDALVVAMATEDGWNPAFTVENLEIIKRRPAVRHIDFGDYVSLETRPGSKAKSFKAVVILT